MIIPAIKKPALKIYSAVLRRIKQLALETYPAMWFAAGLILACCGIALYFSDLVNPGELSLFTFLWTFAAVLIVFTFLNFNRLRLLKKYRKGTHLFRIYALFIYQILPYLLIAAVYECLVLFSSAFSGYFNYIDPLLMKTDIFLFGINPAVWFEKFYHPAAVEYFMIAYGMYLVYPYFYLLYLFQKNELSILHRTILAQCLALIVSFTCFIIFPAYGPRFVSNPDHPLSRPDMPQFSVQIEGIKIGLLEKLTGRESFYKLQYDGWNNLERLKTDCVPSMHVCLCLICLFYALRYRNIFRWKRFSVWFWAVGVSSLTFSTVYLRYHWIVDTVGGAVLAVICYFLTENIYSRWLSWRKKNGLVEPDIAWLGEADRLKNFYKK